jgi:phosphate transport system substrate-binding protein
MKMALAGILTVTLLTGGFVSAEEQKIRSIGSDTMSHLMKITAEEFKKKHPEVTIEVQEPGSSAGITAMIDGQSDLCPSSRAMKPDEYTKFAEKQGGRSKPLELRVALDGIVIYVHKSNPISELPMDVIARIFSENPNDVVKDSKGKESKPIGPKIKTWGEIDPNLPSEWKEAKIVLYSRNAASGTYGYFKEFVLNNHDFDRNCQEMPGTSSVVNGIAKDKFAIGYGGIGYKTEDVKLLSVSKTSGEPAVTPTPESVSTRKYPIARALYIYVPHKPKAMIKEYLSFILSVEGQTLVADEKVGFVKVPDAMLAGEKAKLDK